MPYVSDAQRKAVHASKDRRKKAASGSKTKKPKAKTIMGGAYK